MGEKVLQKVNKFTVDHDTYRCRQITIFNFDMVILITSFIISMYITKGNLYLENKLVITLIVGLISIIPALIYCGCYKNLWSTGVDTEIICIFTAVIISSVIYFLLNKILGFNYKTIFYIVNGLIIIVGLCGVRVIYRTVRRALLYIKVNSKVEESSKVLIIGAGSAGQLILKEMFENPELNKLPIGVIDDDISKIGKSYYNVSVVGTCDEIVEICKKLDVEEIIFSIAKIDKKRKKEIIQICKNTKCKVRTIPGIYELIDGRVSIKAIRDVSIDDLLGRECIKLDNPKTLKFIKNKKVLITGAGGSIGSELCRQVASLNPYEMILVDIYENNAYEIQQELIRKYGDKLKLTVLIASVRDNKRIEDIFSHHRPEIVFHAAAHKHVPLMEDSPCEAIKNNVFGTLNVAQTASKYEAERFVLISTDKAVNPTNIMGATKRCCEMIVQTLDNESETEFVAVRFGNVLGSNGSVVPLFKKQIAQGGPVKVTHPEITRFFMTIPEAVSLVLEAGSMAKGGEIFVLNMGDEVKILDLAKNLIRLSGFEPDVDMKIEFTGLRPGEKLYEEVLMDEEGLTTTENEKIHIGKPIEMDRALIFKRLEKLREVAEKEDDYEVRCVMKSLVDTYVIKENKEAIHEIAITADA